MANQWRLPGSTRSTSITNLTLCSKQAKRKWRYKFKFLDLYKEKECLWMENHKDFLNFELKDEVWEQLAQEMCCPERPHPKPDKWRHLVIKWRYNVQLEQLRKQEAKHFDKLNELPRKLRYSDRLQFLIKHTFDRKKNVQAVTPVARTPEPLTSPTQESLAAKCMRLGRCKSKLHTSFGQKLRTMEKIRNKRCCTMCLSPEALHRIL
ncbi:PREDICTED: uncharacterized protein LOC108610723 [Drosophila arizonae]|uniref:Uncharacterized protein LOC108610723 n=1 Tax=Drosophila arizonae TaxID=7263 RepID=A0ABM1NU43_DROAR|nr:PREDICTED: uncharacterized protein LOC108610723 [Drosophila arizonae]